MIKIAVYGKGGIGKSTTVSNVAAALAEHTVAIGVGKADILSSFEYVEQVLGDKAI